MVRKTHPTDYPVCIPRLPRLSRNLLQRWFGRVAPATGCQRCEATRGRERKIRGYQLNAIISKPAQDRRFIIDFLSVNANYMTYLLGLRPTGNQLPVPPAHPPKDIATQSLPRGNESYTLQGGTWIRNQAGAILLIARLWVRGNRANKVAGEHDIRPYGVTPRCRER